MQAPATLFEKAKAIYKANLETIEEICHPNCQSIKAVLQLEENDTFTITKKPIPKKQILKESIPIKFEYGSYDDVFLNRTYGDFAFHVYANTIFWIAVKEYKSGDEDLSIVVENLMLISEGLKKFFDKFYDASTSVESIANILEKIGPDNYSILNKKSKTENIFSPDQGYRGGILHDSKLIKAISSTASDIRDMNAFTLVEREGYFF